MQRVLRAPAFWISVAAVVVVLVAILLIASGGGGGGGGGGYWSPAPKPGGRGARRDVRLERVIRLSGGAW